MIYNLRLLAPTDKWPRWIDFKIAQLSHFTQSSVSWILNNWMLAIPVLSQYFKFIPNILMFGVSDLKFLLNLLKDARSDNLTAKWQWMLSGLLPTHLSQHFFAAEQVKIMKSNLQNWGADNILCHSASQSKKGQKHMLSPIEFEKCWWNSEIFLQ